MRSPSACFQWRKSFSILAKSLSKFHFYNDQGNKSAKFAVSNQMSSSSPDYSNS